MYELCDRPTRQLGEVSIVGTPVEVSLKDWKSPHPPKIDVTITQPDRFPKWLDKDGNFWDSSEADGLYKSTDGCATWNKVADAPSHGVAYLAENLIVSDTGRVIWGTNKNFFYVSDPAVENWTRYDFTNGQSVKNYGYHKYKNVILLANYGAELATIVPECYASFDHGETFTLIFQDAATGGYHIHDVAYDPWGDRIYLSLGEARQDIAYSDDRGTTWHYLFGTMGTSGFQPTQIIPTPRGILFGSDHTPNGLTFLPRPQSPLHFYPEPTDLVRDFYILDGLRPNVMQLIFRRGWYNIESKESHTYLFAVGHVPSSTNPGYDKILASVDGISFHEIWVDMSGSDYVLHYITGPVPGDTGAEFFAVLSNDALTEYYQLKGKFPTFSD